jgi:hypothetical protein
MSVRSGSRTLIGTVLLAFATMCLVLALSQNASAGTYTIDNCPAAPGGNGDSGPWTVFGAPQSIDGSCSSGPGDFIGPLGGSMSATQLDGVQVVTPAGSGITINEARVWWAVPKQSSGADNFAIAADNAGALGEVATPLSEVAPPSHFVLPSSTTELTFADYCSNDDASTPCVFGAGENPNLELYGAELTLQDGSLPSGSVTGGALIAGEALGGEQALSYTATDASSGVRLVQLRIDGNLVAQKDYLASCPYTNFLACPASVSDTIAWNTASVGDGEHSLEVLIQSAAQSTSVIYDGTIHVHNASSAASLGALPGPGASGGSSPTGLGLVNGAGASEAAQLHLGVSRTIRRPFSQRALSLAGRLLTTEGQPIAGAKLDVLQQLLGTAGEELVGHATTRADGTFVASVPPGRSRTVTLAYRAYAADGGYAAQAKVAEEVGAGVKLRISRRRTGPSGHIELSGSVEGPIPAGGVVVDLLVYYRGLWVPFRTPRTDGEGHFHRGYQFQGAVGRFPFRAEVLGGQSDFPYSGGRSQVIDVSTS